VSALRLRFRSLLPRAPFPCVRRRSRLSLGIAQFPPSPTSRSLTVCRCGSSGRLWRSTGSSTSRRDLRHQVPQRIGKRGAQLISDDLGDRVSDWGHCHAASETGYGASSTELAGPGSTATCQPRSGQARRTRLPDSPDR
jgi:hypothetical protein